jgi:hypothetical protein
MKPTSLELTFDSVDALLRTYGINALEKLHEDVENQMPNTTFDCPRLTIWYAGYKVVLARRLTWSEIHEDVQSLRRTN